MDKPLRFCMVSTFYPPYNFGGDGIHIYRLSNELAKRGHSVDVFYCEDSYRFLKGAEPSGNYPNHRQITIRGIQSGKGFFSPLLTQQTGRPVFKPLLKKALEENQYDVIHYHNMSLIGIKALGFGSAVKLYTTHEHWLICPMHVLWKYNREVCTKKSCFRCQLFGKRPPQLWRYTDMLGSMLKNVDCFISPSRFTLHKHADAGLDIPIAHIPYFLPMPAEVSPISNEHVPVTRPYFLFVGRLEQIKGLQNVIPVFRKHPEYDLLIAGDGEYRSVLTTMAAGAPNIKFLGRLDQQQLSALYELAVAVIVPSICFETFGIIIIEAFARKTPVIVNNLGALPEVVEDSGGGFIYEGDNELVLAMTKLAADTDLRNDLGRKGYDAYLKFWNEEAHMERYLALVNELRARRFATEAQMHVQV